MPDAGTANKTRYKVAVIPGDGIGNEVVPEGVRVLEAVGRIVALQPRQQELDVHAQNV